MCVFPHSYEGPLEVQQLCFGLREVPVVTTQLKHPQHQHQRTVLRDKTDRRVSDQLTGRVLKTFKPDKQTPGEPVRTES